MATQMIRPAFLVSDEALKSLRTQPWVIEMTGEAVFMHESVLGIAERFHNGFQEFQQKIVHNSRLGKPGPFYCDQPNCEKAISKYPFKTLAVRNYHLSVDHGIPGQYSRKSKQQAEKRRQLRLTQTLQLLPPSTDQNWKTKKLKRTGHYPASAYQSAQSYQYAEFDKNGVCGIDDCDWQPKHGKKNPNYLRLMHFHRSVKHNVRGINWSKNHKGTTPGQVRSKFDGRLKRNKNRGMHVKDKRKSA